LREQGFDVGKISLASAPKCSGKLADAQGRIFRTEGA
jgi:hypothetical protein